MHNEPNQITLTLTLGVFPIVPIFNIIAGLWNWSRAPFTSYWQFAYAMELTYGTLLFLSYLFGVEICSRYDIIQFYVSRMHIVVELLMILLVWRANRNFVSSSETFAYVLHAINIFVIILSWSMVDVRFG